MRRLVALAGSFALTAVLSGCGADAHEEAAAVATGEALVMAPPGATGADVLRPAPTMPTSGSKTGVVPSPLGGNAPKPAPGNIAEPVPADPVPDPAAPAPGETPPKGTEL